MVPKPSSLVAYAITSNPHKPNTVNLNIVNFYSHGNSHTSSILSLDSHGGAIDSNACALLGFSGLPTDRMELNPGYLLVLKDLKIDQNARFPNDLYMIDRLGSN